MATHSFATATHRYAMATLLLITATRARIFKVKEHKRYTLSTDEMIENLQKIIFPAHPICKAVMQQNERGCRR